jgi:hypothetical protein
LGLQVVFGESSITVWVRTLQRTPLLARLCGGTGKVPAVGTFYGFLDRLYPDRPRRRNALRRPSGRKLKLRPGQTRPPKRPGATDRVAREADRSARPRVTDRWNALLAASVQQSVARGVIPTTWDLAVDGTPVESGAYSFGRKVCACPAQRCGCLRRFSDPDALLGWDSYRNRYYFGYNAVVLTVANAVPGQIAHPVVVSLARPPANRPDGITYPDLLVKTQRRYAGTGCRLARVIGDAAFDVDALGTFTQARGVTSCSRRTPAPAAPSERRGPGRRHPVGPGPPPDLCGGSSVGPPRVGPTWRPEWGGPLRNRTAAPCPTPCAKAGQRVSVNFRGTRYDPMALPYRSAAWDPVYAQRTAVERSQSGWEVTGVKAARHRRRFVWYGRLVIAAIAQHIQTWVRAAA